MMKLFLVSFGCLGIVTVTACGPSFPDHDRAKRDTFGKVLYELIEAAVDQGDCGAVRGPILRDSRDQLIDDLDTVLSPDARNLVPEFVKGRIRPLVVNGKLPALTDAARDMLIVLRDPMLDPERKLPTALARLDPGDIAGHHAVTLGSEMLAEDGLEPRVHEVVQFLLKPRGRERELDRILGIAHRELTRFNMLRACDSGSPKADPVAPGERALLSTAGFTAQGGLTSKRWAVRANAKGWPLGRAVMPFGDGNGDGVADTDAEGRPLDAARRPVMLSAFGWNTPYDDVGVARNASGEPMYRYFGIDETGLWHLYRGLHSGIRDDLHERVLSVSKAVLGNTVPCGNNEPGCEVYPATDHAIADLAFLGFEALRSPNIENLLAGFSQLTRQNKALAETLVALGAQTGEALLAGPISSTSPETLEFTSATLDLFKQLETPGQRTPLVGELLATLHGVHRSGVDIRKIMATSIKAANLTKTPLCGPQDPQIVQMVDYSKPRSVNGADNRSALEKGIDAFAKADCGSINGGTVAELVVKVAASLQPSQACQVINWTKASLGALNEIPVLGDLTLTVLTNIGCSNAPEVLSALDELDLLAKTGSLELLIPMSRVFVARNKTRELVDAMKFLKQDFAKDDAPSGTSRSFVRAMMPTIIAFVDDPKSEAAFQLIDFMGGNSLPGQSETIAQSTAVAMTELFETKTVTTRQGSVSNTSLAGEALKPYTQIAARLEGLPAKAELQSLERHLLTHAFARTSGGMKLEDPNVVPLLGSLSAMELVSARLSPEARTCTIDRAQGFVTGFMISQDLPALMTIVEDFSRETSVKQLSRWLLSTLDPSRPEGAKPATNLLLLGATLIQQQHEPSDIRVAARDLEVILERDHGGIGAILDAVDELVTSDMDRFVLPATRRLLAEREGPDKAPPYENISNLVARLASIRKAESCQVDDNGLSAADIDAALDGAIALLRRDNDALLGKIYQLFLEQQ